MAQITEYDPTTLKRVPNHDAARRQKELESVLAKLNQGNTQIGQPGEPIPQPPQPSVESGSTVDPATALQPTIIEIPDAPIIQPTVVVPEVIQSQPTVTLPSPDEYAKLQKSYREAQQALTPVMQKNAVLLRDLKDERESTQAELKSLKETLAELTQFIKQPTRREPVYEPEVDTELESLDPMIAERFRRFNRSTQDRIAEMERKHQTELQAIRDEEKKRQESIAAQQANRSQQNWLDTFKKMVPDYTDFMANGPKAVAFTEWAHQQPDEYDLAISAPMAYSPFFVAKMINEYKSSLVPTPTPARQPSLGDLASRSLSGTAPVKIATREVENPLSEYEIRNATAIMDKMTRDALATKDKEVRAAKLSEANEFMARFERSMSK